MKVQPINLHCSGMDVGSSFHMAIQVSDLNKFVHSNPLRACVQKSLLKIYENVSH